MKIISIERNRLLDKNIFIIIFIYKKRQSLHTTLSYENLTDEELINNLKYLLKNKLLKVCL